MVENSTVLDTLYLWASIMPCYTFHVPPGRFLVNVSVVFSFRRFVVVEYKYRILLRAGDKITDFLGSAWFLGLP